MTILVTGATGYIGGRLVPRLLADGHSVRVIARDARRLAALETRGAERVEGDVLKPETLAAALQGITVAYYLIHSMGAETDFAERDREAAHNFAVACDAAGVQRIIYLGGLGVPGIALSKHLASRHETGDVLRTGPVPVTELRAAIIVGAGSASFEIIRDLAGQLPLMICPRWVRSRCEPIALEQVLDYLVGVLHEPRSIGQTLEIGGGEVLTYEQMMRKCAAAMGRTIRILVVPVLTPRLSSYWLNLVTSVPIGLARPLVEGLRNDVVTTEQRIREWIPLPLVTFRQSVESALQEALTAPLASRWTGAAGGRAALRTPTVRTGALRDERVLSARTSSAVLFAAVERIGGETGWYYGDWLWRVRGLIDRLLGGVGMRRGRRDPDTVTLGDPIDFWRVEEVVPGRLLRLRAEMMLPGSATLEFEVSKTGRDDESFLSQRASFFPGRVWGRAYWYALLPLHEFVFRGMAAGLVRAAEARMERT